MTAIGFVGGSHAGTHLETQLLAAGALKSTIIDLRGWQSSLQL